MMQCCLLWRMDGNPDLSHKSWDTRDEYLLNIIDEYDRITPSLARSLQESLDEILMLPRLGIDG